MEGKKMTIKMKVALQVSAFLLFTLVWVSIPAFADSDDDCHGNPHHCGGEDGEDGEDGQDGEDGIDGRDGIDGMDGVDGADGRDGIDGRDGAAGVVSTEWITETRTSILTINKWYREVRDAASAQAAMQVHLPQDQTSRLTLGLSSVNGTAGVGIGYAYMFDNEKNTALTVAVGMAGDETAAKASFGFEFGGQRKMTLPAIAVAPLPEEPDPVPTGMVQINEDEYNNLLIAQVQQEEFDDAVEQAKNRYAQQQSLIEELQEEVASHDSEQDDIDRLTREAAALRARQEEEAAAKARVRERYAKRAEGKKDEPN